MADAEYKDAVEIAEECQVLIDNNTITVKGGKGELSKKITDPSIQMSVDGNKAVFKTKKFSKKSKKLINTYKAHIKNMSKGVVEGHVYKLRVCSGHFPMTVSVKDNVFEIKNFIGEKVPRKLAVKEGTEVKIDGTEIIVESTSKEKAGQMAASIEQLTRRPGFDTRIFQDGIYIIEKDGKQIK